MAISAYYIAGEAANAYDEASTGHVTSTTVEKMGHSKRQAWRVIAEGDELLAFENLPGGLVRCWDNGCDPVDLQEPAAIAWARERGTSWGKATLEEA